MREEGQRERGREGGRGRERGKEREEATSKHIREQLQAGEVAGALCERGPEGLRRCVPGPHSIVGDRGDTEGGGQRTGTQGGRGDMGDRWWQKDMT